MLDRKLIMFIIIVLALFSISVVSANDDVVADEQDYNAQIIAENVTHEYTQSMGNEIYFSLRGADGKPIEGEAPTVTYDNKNVNAFYDNENHFGKGLGTYIVPVHPQAGNHNIIIELNTSRHLAESVLLKVNIVKAPVKLALDKYVTTTKGYAVMKATVKDRYNRNVCEGIVKFKINGKEYNVNVKNGVAIKKVKLSKAGAYNYKATFASANYQTKSLYSKVFIKQTKKYYTLKIRSFKVKLPYRKYVKVLDAKNKGKWAYADIFTGIKRSELFGGGYYSVGLSTNDDYFTHHGYDKGDYIYLYGGGGYLDLKKVNLYTSNF